MEWKRGTLPEVENNSRSFFSSDSEVGKNGNRELDFSQKRKKAVVVVLHLLTPFYFQMSLLSFWPHFPVESFFQP